MTVPVLRMPLQVLDGRMITIPAGSPAEVGQSVALLVATSVGERRSVPEYGLEPALFSHRGVREDQVRDAVEEWEPRADITGIDIAVDPTTGEETVTVWAQPYDLEEID